ncbi:hypothetical protein LCGC14_0163030 [marine sediment metagenome]|uniref:Uncharacterized protein n=1 Tax=marine sediment metagenome TaxID=412755 RepID=A0A0F9UY55_9ZZZZ
MLNSTLFGGYEARAALAKASLKLAVDTDWCVGGCTPWKETPEGRQRHKEISKINADRKKQGLTYAT